MPHDRALQQCCQLAKGLGGIRECCLQTGESFYGCAAAGCFEAFPTNGCNRYCCGSLQAQNIHFPQTIVTVHPYIRGRFLLQLSLGVVLQAQTGHCGGHWQGGSGGCQEL